MMRLKDLNELITARAMTYEPRWWLLRKLNDEWRGYVNRRGGYYKWLAAAVAVVRPRRILELGTYTGSSALMMYSEMQPDSTLVSVDSRRDHRFVPPEVFSDPRVRFVIGNDLDSSIFGMRIPVNVDFLFIDTEHTYEQVSREWAVYKRWLLDGAIVALDDIRMNDMPRFWNELQYEKLDLTEFCHPESGFGVFRVTQS